MIRYSVTRFVTMRLAIALCLAALCYNGHAQSIAQLTKAGDKKFSEGDYYAASIYYRDALRKEDENVALNFKYAESLRLFNDYAGAAEAYKAVIKYDNASQYAMAYFWYGEMLKSSCECKYQEAIKQFQKFRNKYRKKDYYYAKNLQEMEACSWAIDNVKTKDSVKIEHLGKDVNTEKSEFNATHVYPDRVQFSALRNLADDEKNANYKVRIYNSQPNPAKIFIPNGANPELHIGNVAYTPDTKRFYFTQCEQIDKTNTRCDIYVSRFEDFKWAPAEKLPATVNDAKASNTHPSPGYDLKGNEVLFFASDREGGQGQMDIWVSRIKGDGTYEQAVNLGNKINTQGSEVTPFYDINNKKLYFSSDWHYGFGGYDIFETTGENANWSTPKNLLLPINTAQNDLYYSRAFDDSRAYITSNRKGSYFIEAETCCNDIYAYNTGRKVERRDTVVTAKIDTPLTKTDTTVTAVLDTPPPIETVVVVDTPETQQPVVVKAEEPGRFIDDKIKGLKQYLPVALYFHNDEPDCCNLRDTTKLNYVTTYEAYSARMNEYRKNYGQGLQGDAKTKAEQEITELFTNKVDKGFYDLVAFSSQLLDLLKEGNKIEIAIKGYCSPLNYNQYNIQLGYRRVASLRNYFYHYRDGILMPYINNNSFIITNLSFGEETSNKTVSDNLKDTRNSVYNPAAAVERRVEIVSVELK